MVSPCPAVRTPVPPSSCHWSQRTRTKMSLVPLQFTQFTHSSVQISLSTSHKGGAGRPKEFSSHRGQLIWTRPFPPFRPVRRECFPHRGWCWSLERGLEVWGWARLHQIIRIVIIDHRAIGRRKVAFWRGMSEFDAMRWSDDR